MVKKFDVILKDQNTLILSARTGFELVKMFIKFNKQTALDIHESLLVYEYKIRCQRPYKIRIRPRINCCHD